MLPLVPAPRHLTRVADAPGAPVAGDIVVELDPAIGAECYELTTAADTVLVRAGDDAGVLRARATLAQLALAADDGRYPAVRIVDGPRFAYRGFMLDVARHFHPPRTICEILDLMAELKLNHLHLHLSDDQGWRLAIDGRPELTGIGASTQCQGGAGPDGGGYLTREDYRRIQDHAASLAITVVPEIDVPGHTNAVLVSYPELAVDGVTPVPYEGAEVGFSQLDAANEETYRFWTEVVSQLAADTDGPYLHLGGDEALEMTERDFLTFLERAFAIVAATGKTPVAWHEAGRSDAIPAGAVGQYWNFVRPRTASEDRFGIDHADCAGGFPRQGGRLILSPSDAVYLDHREAEGLPGVAWAAGPTPLRASYEWEPSAVLPDVPDDAILGVEAALWTEYLGTREELLELMLPRLAAVAELAWSPAPHTPRRIEDIAPRLAELGRDWQRRGLPFTRSTEVDW
ncbi:MAG: family 20 glycosylhydrolase [Salana multivorans]|uniref:family 20 glycosylhydrolase n=1 Tax=Salana multivorans TaxID=120377 RepID=UPI0009641DEA|nr:family 20 glycosylhydrolase [Salana multivorans]MBN8881306.1 family 20 glycosylhydrolase [Salana multivorans]OJX98234.1 MAG: hypothetical protein BGO96_03290 [Micrococcales bacterium 73-15]